MQYGVLEEGCEVNYATQFVSSERRNAGLACDVCPVRPCLICRPLPEAARPDLEAAMRAERYRAGEEIPDRTAGDVAVISNGLALAERTLADDRRQVVAFRFPGDLLRPDAPCGNTPLRLAAVTPTVVCWLPGAAVAKLSQHHAALETGLLGQSCREVGRLGERLFVLGRLSAPERIATFLLEMLVRGGGQPEPDGGVVVRLPMSREDIADYLGLNVETVSRTLSRFKREGLIRLPKPGRAVIGDTGPLRKLAPLADEYFEGVA